MLTIQIIRCCNKINMNFHHQSLSSAFTVDNSTTTKKRVTFKPTVTVHEVDTHYTTQEEKSNLYFTKHELKMINLEVRSICSSLSSKLKKTIHHQTPQTTLCLNDQASLTQRSDCDCVIEAVESDDVLRGLEFFIFPKRFKNKVIARKALLKYQTHLKVKYPDITPEEKARAMRTASVKMTAWSYLVAQETARLDSLRAYEADYFIPLVEPVPLSRVPTLALKKKKGPFKEIRRVTFDYVPPRSCKKAKAA